MGAAWPSTPAQDFVYGASVFVEVTGTRTASLDFIGYALKDKAAQAVLRDYESGALSLEQMSAELDALAN